jgi:hypothetical protein
MTSSMQTHRRARAIPAALIRSAARIAKPHDPDVIRDGVRIGNCMFPPSCSTLIREPLHIPRINVREKDAWNPETARIVRGRAPIWPKGADAGASSARAAIGKGEEERRSHATHTVPIGSALARPRNTP